VLPAPRTGDRTQTHPKTCSQGVIRVFNIPAITWTLTAVLLAGGTYHLWQAFRSRHLTDRVNNSLHALMNALMAAMLWNLAPSTVLAQIGLLAGAALWFVIQAVARPEFKILCAGTQGRLKCAYHALTMTGAALMITMMTHPTTSPGRANADANVDAGRPPCDNNRTPHHHNSGNTIRPPASPRDPPDTALRNRRSHLPDPPPPPPGNNNHPPPPRRPETLHPHRTRTRSHRRHHHGPHVRHHDRIGQDFLFMHWPTQKDR
jgi:hypothetical protein